MQKIKVKNGLLTVNNLEKYQHYSDRNIVWIKWYIDCLQDEKFMELSPSVRWVFIGLVLLACRNNNKIPYNTNWLERTLNVKKINGYIDILTNSKLIAGCYPNAIPIREDKIREDKICGCASRFEQIWQKYPNRDGRKEAYKHFTNSVKTEQDWNDIQKALAHYLSNDNVKRGFIKNGATWFNNWRDWIDNWSAPVQKTEREMTPEEKKSREEFIARKQKETLERIKSKKGGV